MNKPTPNQQEQLTILIDGQSVECERGASVASVLMARGCYGFSLHPVNSEARGAFCMMGACQSCRILIDGRSVLACQFVVRQGLVIDLIGDAPQCENTLEKQS